MSKEIVVANMIRFRLRLDLVSDPGVVLRGNHHENRNDDEQGSLYAFADQTKQTAADKQHAHSNRGISVQIIKRQIKTLNLVLGTGHDSPTQSMPIRAVELVTTRIDLYAYVDCCDAK